MRTSFIIPILGLLLLQSGCALFEPALDATRKTRRLLTPKPFDRRDTTEEYQDPYRFVNKIGRGNRRVDKDPDPLWLRKISSSEKARAINRSLGFE